MSLELMKVSLLKYKVQVKKLHLIEAELNELLDLAEKGIKQMIQLQKDCLKMDSYGLEQEKENNMKKIVLASNNSKKIKEIKEYT